MNEREVVLDILLEVLEEGRYSHIVLRDVLEKYQYVDKRKRAFITRVTEGTIERLIEMDYIINSVSKVKVKKMKPVIRNLIRSAVYQLKYMDSVPSSAICNETVKLATKRGFGGLRGFVNGVLRNIDRNLESIVCPKKDIITYYSVKYSLPIWLVKKWIGVYGEETFEKMAESFLQDSPTTIRVNIHRISKSECMDRLREEGVQVEEHPYLDYALNIHGYDSLPFLESFQEGLFYVQDISSMLVSEIADPKPGDFVIDVCAAPGGKALHMAEKLKGTGMVEARDLTDYKVEYIEENIERSELKNIRALRQDATLRDETAVGKADIVIADLPCSGLGVLGKKTDLKYKVKEESLGELASLQKEILQTVVDYVKPGGRLIYSTCTIGCEENEGNARWIREELGLEPLDISLPLSEELKNQVSEQKNLQLLPGIHKSDGFFIAGFRKLY